MRLITIASLFALGLIAGCVAVGRDRVLVEGVGREDLLKLRAGPGLQFNVILGLPDGTRLIRRDCVTEIGQRWCQVALADAPAITGYVAEDYLSAP